MNLWDLEHAFNQKIQNTKNFCLVKEVIGKGKPSIRHLPDSTFTYGKKYNFDVENAGVITRSWKTHIPSTTRKQQIDFMKLNKEGIKAGSVSAKDLTAFKSTHANIRRKAIENRKDKSKPNIPNDMIFGKTCKPSTPFNGIIGNLYGNVLEAQNNSIYSKKVTFSSQAITQKLRPPKTTKATQLAANQILQNMNTMECEPLHYFKLNKFKQVRSRTNSSQGRLFLSSEKLQNKVAYTQPSEEEVF